MSLNGKKKIKRKKCFWSFKNYKKELNRIIFSQVKQEGYISAIDVLCETFFKHLKGLKKFDNLKIRGFFNICIKSTKNKFQIYEVLQEVKKKEYFMGIFRYIIWFEEEICVYKYVRIWYTLYD